MGAQLGAWREDRREVHLFPHLLQHYRCGRRGEIPDAGRAHGQIQYGFCQEPGGGARAAAAIWAAAAQGHEIGNHTCGHFDGKDWTKDQWLSEFRSFDAILGNAFRDNGFGYEPQGWRQFVKNGIKGFRAPYLSTDKALYEALAARGFRYDASGVEREIARAQGQCEAGEVFAAADRRRAVRAAHHRDGL